MSTLFDRLLSRRRTTIAGVTHFGRQQEVPDVR